MIILLALLVVVVLGVVAVVRFFNSGASKYRSQAKAARADLADANERVSICQTALIQIASGDPSPVSRASNALAEISRSYVKGI